MTFENVEKGLRKKMHQFYTWALARYLTKQ